VERHAAAMNLQTQLQIQTILLYIPERFTIGCAKIIFNNVGFFKLILKRAKAKILVKKRDELFLTIYINMPQLKILKIILSGSKFLTKQICGT